MLPHQELYKDGQKVDPTLPFASVVDLLTQHNASYPDKEAMVFIDVEAKAQKSYSYKDVYSMTASIAALLQNHGITKGDVIALHLSNCPEILLFHLAAWVIGAITVPLDLTRDSRDRKLFKLHTTNAKMLVTRSKQDGNDLQQNSPELILLALEDLVFQKDTSLSKGMTPDSTALILFTSGTTAHPKGVSLTLENLFLNADGIADWLKITEDDRFFIVLPLHHINATTMSLATILRGGTVVLASRYSKSQFFSLMAQNACTLSSIVPTICLDLLSEREQFTKWKHDLHQVSRIQIGSAPVVQKDVAAFVDMYKIPLVQGYGSTETALRVAGVTPWGEKEILFQTLIKENTIGKELKWNNLRIQLPSGKEAKELERGEVCIRGPVVTTGYYNDEEETAKAFYNGWFHSGDIGYWKELAGEKYYFIDGRSKEIIIKGGVNISPLAVEEAISSEFSEIKACFVVGIPDPRFGEEIAAVIIFHETCSRSRKREIKDILQSNRQTKKLPTLSAYESPLIVYDVSESLLPMTSTGKVQRVMIKAYVKDMRTSIAETETHLFRKLTPFDEAFVHQLVTIQERWGKNFSFSKQQAKESIANGVVIGAIEKRSEQVAGFILTLRVQKDAIEQLTESLKTYDQATSNLTLQAHDPNGDALLLVSVATQGKPFQEEIATDTYTQLLPQAKALIKEYVLSGRDPVLSLHMKPKAGMEKGAFPLHIIPHGRPIDKAAMGYSVIMQYPTLPTTITVNPDASLGVQLLEAAFQYAITQRVYHVYAYSRPAGFYKYLTER
jgi:long-chain acyl-CoA synthetase